MNKEKIEEKALKIYPENFAWVRCNEDSETYTEIDADGIKWLKVDANKTYREGYIKALLETESLPKIKGWVARDYIGDYLCFFNNKPVNKNKGRWEDENTNTGSIIARYGEDPYSELTWESEPLEVELILRPLIKIKL